MPRISIFAPVVPQRPEQLLPYGQLAQRLGIALWQGQATVVEPGQGFGYLAGAGVRVPVGLGVTLAPLRHPYYAALEARSIAAITGQPVVFGLGPGGRQFQKSVLSEPYVSVLSSVRDYVGTMRSLLQGDPVAIDSDTFSAHTQLGGPPAPNVSLGLGVLRPRMAELAGEVADVVITWLAPPAYLRDVIVPALDRGAERAGRPRPHVVTILPVARRRARHEPYKLALASNFAHSRAPHYVDMLRRAGIDINPADPVSGAKAIVAAGSFVCGDTDEIIDHVAEYRAAGVDEIALNVTGIYNVEGARGALEELEALTKILMPGEDTRRSLGDRVSAQAAGVDPT